MRNPVLCISILFLCLSSGLRASSTDSDSYNHSISETAIGMDVAPSLVASVRTLGYNEDLSWIVMRLCKRSGKSAAEIQELRKTRPWGEVAEACGNHWVEINSEVRRLAAAARLQPDPGTLAQQLRAGSNRRIEDSELSFLAGDRRHAREHER